MCQSNWHIVSFAVKMPVKKPQSETQKPENAVSSMIPDIFKTVLAHYDALKNEPETMQKIFESYGSLKEDVSAVLGHAGGVFDDVSAILASGIEVIKSLATPPNPTETRLLPTPFEKFCDGIAREFQKEGDGHGE